MVITDPARSGSYLNFWPLEKYVVKYHGAVNHKYYNNIELFSKISLNLGPGSRKKLISDPADPGPQYCICFRNNSFSCILPHRPKRTVTLLRPESSNPCWVLYDSVLT